MPEDLDKDQIARIFEHRANSIDFFYNRLNAFLIFESILFGIIGLLYSRSNPPILVGKVFMAFGMLITLIWWYVLARQRHYADVVTSYAQENIPEYRAIRAKVKKEIFPAFGQKLLTHAIPVLVLVVWILLLVLL
jgi:hypothetical protein